MCVLLTCVVMGLVAYVSASTLTLYVAPNGNDSHTGTVNAPFATLQRAQTALRSRESGGTAQVMVRSGKYPQSSTLLFDSPLDGDGVEWIVEENDTASKMQPSGVTLSFGIPVTGTGWIRGTGNLWHQIVPEVASGSVYPRQLWDATSGDRLQRARSPNRGKYFVIPLNNSALSGGLQNQGFKYAPGTLNQKQWTEMNDMEIVTFASWTTSRHYIAQLNATPGNYAVTFTSPCGFDPTGSWPNSGNRFYAENAVEMVDSDDEWYISRATGLLTLYSTTDPTTRNLVLDRGAAVREGILVKASNDGKITLIPENKKVFNTTTFPSSTIPWGNSSFDFSAVVETTSPNNLIFTKGPKTHAHVQNDKRLYIQNGILNLDMGWIGHLGKVAPGTDTLQTRHLSGDVVVSDGKPHTIQIKYDESTSNYTILVDGVVDAHASFGSAWDGSPDDWDVEIASNFVDGYVSDVSFSYQRAQPIENLHFIGNFKIEHVGWNLGRDDVTDMQAVSYLSTAAVHFSNLHHSTVTGMIIQHVGGMGLWVEGSSTNVTIANVLVTDVGAGGLRVGRGNPLSSEPVDNPTRSISVNNSKFLHGSQVFEAGNGVLLQNSPLFSLTHSEVAYFGHAGVTLGWVWGFAPITTYANTIEWNHVHHVGNNLLSDLGGIYALGEQPGTRIRYNLVHHSEPYFMYGHGVYLDEGSSGITVESNWIHSTYHAHFMQHYGVDNVIQNNVFATSIGGCVAYQSLTVNKTLANATQCAGYLWDPAYRGQNCSYTFLHNIIAMSGSQGFVHAGPEGRCDGKFKSNLYHNASGTITNTFPGNDSSVFPSMPDNLRYRYINASFADWQYRGFDGKSLIGDPQFTSSNPIANNDFRIEPTSPAITTLGFVPFDLTTNVGPNW